MSAVLSVVAVVIERDNKRLVCQRPAHKRHGLLWEFPGGKLEPGETLFEAAQRELFEELSLRVTGSGALLFAITDEASGFQINFLEVNASGEPTLNEHFAMKWCTLQELGELDLAPSDRSFVEFLGMQKRG